MTTKNDPETITGLLLEAARMADRILDDSDEITFSHTEPNEKALSAALCKLDNLPEPPADGFVYDGVEKARYWLATQSPRIEDRAAGDVGPLTPDNSATAWLIESKFEGPQASWWNGTPQGQGKSFTTDHNKAVRFSRREDAEAVAKPMHMVFVTEHVWISSTPAALASATPSAAVGEETAQLSEMKLKACEAHRLCYELMQRHPEIAELGDDGELHCAIHAILAVDTPSATPTKPGHMVVPELIHAKFRSGNSIPVERIVITRYEYKAMLNATQGGKGEGE